MTRFESSFRSFTDTSLFILRAIGGDIAGHWVLALFSLIGATAIWFVIQDVENPRVQAVVPLEELSQGIPVEYVNLSPDYVVDVPERVRVRVEARESDVPELRPGDFRATVDLANFDPQRPATLPVTVTALDDSVTVLTVEPSRVEVELIEVATQEMPVEVNITGSLPDGFDGEDSFTVEPAFVTVSGRPELVRNVASVQLDVNLSGRRQSFDITGDLVPRNRNGDTQIVSLNPPRATAAFTITPTFVEKTLPIRHRITGMAAPGFRVNNISVSPQFAIAAGPEDIIDGLTELTLEPIDIGGATTNVQQTRAIQVPPNVTVDSERAIVEVGIGPITCSATADGPCAPVAFYVSPQFTDVPATVTVAPGSYVLRVDVAGPLAAIVALDPGSIHAPISLEGAGPGTATYTADVTVPDGLEVTSVEPISVTLLASAVP